MPLVVAFLSYVTQSSGVTQN